jgi:hypothetical protein
MHCRVRGCRASGQLSLFVDVYLVEWSRHRAWDCRGLRSGDATRTPTLKPARAQQMPPPAAFDRPPFDSGRRGPGRAFGEPTPGAPPQSAGSLSSNPFSRLCKPDGDRSSPGIAPRHDRSQVAFEDPAVTTAEGLNTAPVIGKPPIQPCGKFVADCSPLTCMLKMEYGTANVYPSTCIERSAAQQMAHGEAGAKA